MGKSCDLRTTSVLLPSIPTKQGVVWRPRTRARSGQVEVALGLQGQGKIVKASPEQQGEWVRLGRPQKVEDKTEDPTRPSRRGLRRQLHFDVVSEDGWAARGSGWEFKTPPLFGRWLE